MLFSSKFKQFELEIKLEDLVMTGTQEQYFNGFFVQIFNKILALEEQALNRVGADDLSVKELHVLEAVSNLVAAGRNTMTNVADELAIRVSSLTTAVNTLVRKGYLLRESVPGDRRVIQLQLTEKGQLANQLHSRFHREMIQSIGNRLSEPELDVLVRSLKSLEGFFNDTAPAGRNKQEVCVIDNKEI
jgi:DNA-binding MarR family transcriptional regulator